MTEPIPTRESLAGFFASEPRLGTTRTGELRLYARIGVEHWAKEPDGTFTELEPTYHDMAVYGPLAERLQGRFHKGDKFVAHGHTQTYPSNRAGAPGVAQEFVVRRIGHDTARTRYTVQRGPSGDHAAGPDTGRTVNQDPVTSEPKVSGPLPPAVPNAPAESTTVWPAAARPLGDSFLGR